MQVWPPPLPRGLCPVCRAPAPTPRLWTRAHSARLVLTSLSQPLGPSSSASSSRPGRAAWASTWPRRTRSSSTTRTGTRTMTSRSVARRRAPCGCLGGPGFVGLPVAVSGARLPGQPCGLSAPKGTWGGSWRLCPPLQLLTVRRRKRPREGRGCAQGHTATGSLSPHPQDQGHGGRPDEGVSLVTQRGPVWEGTRRTEWGGDKACWRLGRGGGGGGVRKGGRVGGWGHGSRATHTPSASALGGTHTRGRLLRRRVHLCTVPDTGVVTQTRVMQRGDARSLRWSSRHTGPPPGLAALAGRPCVSDTGARGPTLGSRPP